jgi:hypothetical protein
MSRRGLWRVEDVDVSSVVMGIHSARSRIFYVTTG